MGKMVAEVSKAIRCVIYPKVMVINKSPEVTAAFETMEFLNCAGAVDGAHVLIACPTQRST